MVKDINYPTVNEVLTSWENLRRIKNYERVAGTRLFQKLFDRCPEVKALFGYPKDIDPYCDKLSKSRRFIMHAEYWIQMMDSSLNTLGPDIELLTEIMTDLGVKHARYGVKPEMFKIMGSCLIDTLEELLAGDNLFTDSTKEAWHFIYNALTDDMICAQIK